MYVKFDPLIGGRQSILAMASAQKTGGVSASQGPVKTPLPTVGGTAGTDPTTPPDENNDLIAMNSPSPIKSKPTPCEEQADKNNGVLDMKSSSNEVATGMSAKQRLDFEEQLLKKESRMAELERLITESAERTDSFRAECAKRRESEEQMKQVDITKTLCLPLSIIIP